MYSPTTEDPAYLMEGLPEVVTWAIPRGNSITEEHEVLQDTLWVDTNHRADPTEGRVLFLIIPNGAQSLTPHGQELWQEWSNLLRAHKSQPPNGNGCVLQ